MIPASMTAAPRWVVWQYEYRDGKRTKILHDPRTGRRASSTDAETWTTYEEAARVREHYAGIGFVLGDGWIGVDWDHVRDAQTGEWAAVVPDEIRSLETYAEISPSGTGAHAILLGDALPGKRSRAGDGPEFYASGRFFTVTGNHIDGTPEEVQTPPPGALEALYRQYIPAEEEHTRAPGPAPAAALGDDEIIKRATAAKNGEAFSSLFNGDFSGYPSQSEADAALCARLAFWTQDAGQIDRLFRRSGLYREKWDREDYRARTIGSAITRTRETYTAGTRPRGDHPEIRINGRELPEITADALNAIRRHNDPEPTIFIRARAMIRICHDEHDRPILDVMSEAAVRGLLVRIARWVIVAPRKTKTKKGKKTTAAAGGEAKVEAAEEEEEKIEFDAIPADPSLTIVRDVMSLQEWPGLPPIVGVVSSPIFSTENGAIADRLGYDPETRLFYHPAKNFHLAPVPEAPTSPDVTKALNLIREIFVDFPFSSEPDRANTIAALFTAVLRPSISGPVPLWLVSKPQAGSGAGLLQQTIGLIALGTEPPVRTLPQKDEETRKEIFTTIRSAKPLQIYDNIEGRLKSPELAAALTATVMGARNLGVLEDLAYPVRCFWMANGNNVQLGGDLARRTFKTQIDPQVAMPWQRTGFTHENLGSWVMTNRGKILAAIYTIARSWIRAGKPLPKNVPPIGSFEAWRDVIGGIVEHAGIEGFMANANDLYLEGDSDRRQWEGFLSAAWDWTGCNPFTTSALVAFLRDESKPERWRVIDALPDSVADVFAGKRSNFSRVLGNAISKQNGRHFPGGWCIRDGGVEHHAQRWVITRCENAIGCNSWDTRGELGGVSKSEENTSNCGLDKDNPSASQVGELGELQGVGTYTGKMKESKKHIYACGDHPGLTPLTPRQNPDMHDKRTNPESGRYLRPVSRGVSNPVTPLPDPREVASHSRDPADYIALPRPDFGQHCAACGKQGVQHREMPADFNRRRGTAAICTACFEQLDAIPAPQGPSEEHAEEGAA